MIWIKKFPPNPATFLTLTTLLRGGVGTPFIVNDLARQFSGTGQHSSTPRAFSCRPQTIQQSGLCRGHTSR
ncbi:MAG: hypothetical protein ACR2NI_15200, partial [Pirellulales bacterium]